MAPDGGVPSGFEERERDRARYEALIEQWDEPACQLCRAKASELSRAHEEDNAPIYNQFQMNEYLRMYSIAHHDIGCRRARVYHDTLVGAGHEDAKAFLEFMEKYHGQAIQLEKEQRWNESYMQTAGIAPRGCAPEAWHAPRYSQSEMNKLRQQQHDRDDESRSELGRIYSHSLDGAGSAARLELMRTLGSRYHWQGIQLEQARRARARHMQMAERQPMSYAGRAVPGC